MAENYFILMSAKTRENELIFDKDSGRRADEFRFHVHLMGRRYRHVIGRDPSVWKTYNRFLVHQGSEGGQFLVYLSTENFNGNEAADFLRSEGYMNFCAAGLIDSTRRTMRFENPKDPDLCVQLLRRITADDTRFVGYYKGFKIVGPDGISLGKLEDYWIAK